MCMMPVAAFDVPVLLLPPFTKCRRKRWLWRSLIKTAQQNSKPSFVQPQPSLVKPQAGDGRTKRAADLSKPGQPHRWRQRRQRGDVASFQRESERETEEATDRRPTDLRTDQTSSHFPKNLYIPFRLRLQHQEGSGDGGRGNRCSSNGEEDRLGAPFLR